MEKGDIQRDHRLRGDVNDEITVRSMLIPAMDELLGKETNEQ